MPSILSAVSACLRRSSSALRGAAVTAWVRARVAAAPHSGQTTVEYALVLLAVAAVAGILLGWIRGTDLFDKLFDRIVKTVTP